MLSSEFDAKLVHQARTPRQWRAFIPPKNHIESPDAFLKAIGRDATTKAEGKFKVKRCCIDKLGLEGAIPHVKQSHEKE